MKKIAFLATTLLVLSCSSSNDIAEDNANQSGGEWLIPVNEILDGGPGKDGIPSIDNPQFVNVADATFLEDDDLVVGIIKDDVIRAYPHIILDWHEVVNDEIANAFLTINYCPLTGTAFAWESITNNTKSSFGVSGLLYNANLILYDRNTDSNWSQLELKCVNGELINDEPSLYNVVETDWNTWKSLYPNTEVMSTSTGFSRSYGTSPYSDYSTNNERFIFTPSIINSALPNKDRIYAIINNDKSKVYQFSDFNNGHTIKDSFLGKDYLLVGNENIINAFELPETYSNVTFEYEIDSTNGTFFKDSLGNTWSIFGEALSGPQIGDKLLNSKSVVSYWFAIAAFYPNPEIYTP